MFNNEHDIYQFLAKSIVKAIPVPDWEKAEYIAMSQNFDSHLMELSHYVKIGSNEKFEFDIDEGSDQPATGYNLSIDLYKIYQNKPEYKPFNKYKFTLCNDGTFDIEFKYDSDYEYIYSIHPDSEEYDSIEVKDMRAIKSWEGLPQNHPRPWLQQ